MEAFNLESVGLRKVVKSNIKPYVTLKVVGDCNDADYVTTETEYAISEYDSEIERLRDTVNFIKKHKNKLLKRHAISDTNIADEVFNNDYFDMPFDGDDHCHTIDSMEFTYTDENGITVDLEII